MSSASFIKTSSLWVTLLFIAISVKAQDIQWASKLHFQYNSYAETGAWSGENILGDPNSYPLGNLNENAFRLKDRSAYSTLTLGYENPQFIEEIVIVESYLPGKIAKIILYDEKQVEHTVYEGVPQVISTPSRVLVIPLKKTSFRVNKLTIHINTLAFPGWTQVDAVGISSSHISESIINEIGQTDESAIISEKVTFTAERERLDENINTQFIEAKPVISPDGNTLYFVRQDSPSNVGGKRDAQDIYYSDYVNKRWRLSGNIGRPLNDDEPNGICSVSPDGNTILVINAYGESGYQIGSGVSMSELTREGWSPPLQIEINNFSNYNEYEDYFLSNSGQALLMAIEDRDSRGDQDLYVSFRNDDNTFTEPINLGDQINTIGIEFSPFLAADNRTLYFSSDGHPGLGESDIFYSRRLDDTWINWTTPENIGKEINTPGGDAYYTIPAKGDFAYFVSTGQTDSKKTGRDTDIFRISLRKDIKPDPVVLLTGRVLNKKTGAPIAADIEYESIPDKSEKGIAKSGPVDGGFKLVLPAGKNYAFLAKAKGFISVHENADYTNITEYTELNRDLYLVPMEEGQVVQLNNLFFIQGKPEFQPASEGELESLYILLVENPNMTIELGGHTDNQGYFKSNLRLSQERADAVMYYLIGRGIHKKRLSAKGYGPTKPKASNSNPDGRAKNRRVEVTILKY